MPKFDVLMDMRFRNQWDDAYVVGHLLNDRYGVSRLHDLPIAVVPRAQSRRTETNAALTQRSVCIRIGGVVLSMLSQISGSSNSLLGAWWILSIRRVNDLRCSAVNFSMAVSQKILELKCYLVLTK